MGLDSQLLFYLGNVQKSYQYNVRLTGLRIWNQLAFFLFMDIGNGSGRSSILETQKHRFIFIFIFLFTITMFVSVLMLERGTDIDSK